MANCQSSKINGLRRLRLAGKLPHSPLPEENKINTSTKSSLQNGQVKALKPPIRERRIKPKFKRARIGQR